MTSQNDNKMRFQTSRRDTSFVLQWEDISLSKSAEGSNHSRFNVQRDRQMKSRRSDALYRRCTDNVRTSDGRFRLET